METSLPNRFSRLRTTRGPVLRNRLVVPPMASQTADEAGLVTERTLAHYARLSEARPALLIAEYTFVHRSGRSEENQLGIDRDEQLAGLAKLAARIQASGALAGIQLTHAGGKTERALTGGQLQGPSGIAVPVKDRSLEAPNTMTDAELELWKESFARAVDRSVAAGFDLVEFHAAHGYGLNQWLSPITNARNDAYGKDAAGRARLLLELVTAARRKYSGLLLSVRIPGQDFLEGGLGTDDGIRLAQALEAAGVDFVHVSSGIGGWRRPRDRRGEGYLVDEATRIQNVLQIPVIGVGGIETGAYIDESLSEGRFALAAVGRAILADPGPWADKNFPNSETQFHPNRNLCPV